MEFNKSTLDGAYLVKPKTFEDTRGSFTKVFNKELFDKYSLECNFTESYYTFSRKDVLRGMHFQTPPCDHAKLVYVTSGEIMDVILDLRVGSPTFGKFEENLLSLENRCFLYIPKGFAHGFKALKDNSCVQYMQTSPYSPENDTGVMYNSFGYDWKIDSPTVSDRDKSFVDFNDFKSPFKY